MLRKFFCLVVCLAAVMITTAPQSAHAQGIHVGAGRVHVDIGNPHYGRYIRAPYAYGGFGGYGGYRAYYPQATGGHSHWHDTTHYDYHPGGLQPHYDHYDYFPGHYDVHHSGHWHGRH